MRINLIKPLLLLVFVLGAWVNNWAQLEFPEDKVSWKFTIEQNGDEAIVIGTITMEEHWHIYAANLPDGVFIIPTTVELEKSSKFKTVGKLIEPKPIFEHDDLADEDLYYHSHTIKMKQKIKVLSEDDFTLKGTFGFQTCDDTHCLPPHSADFKLKVNGVKADDVEAGKIENSFVEVKGDEAKDKDGIEYVKVDGNWYAVPVGNSIAFYKKYLQLGGSHE